MVCINDLPEQLTALARLYADDTAVYRVVPSCQDQAQLQQDLQRLALREENWDMAFHPFSVKEQETLNCAYQLHDHTLATVDKVKFLHRVSFRKEITWEVHSNKTCSKANKTLGL